MDANLIDTARSQLTSEVVEKAAASTGEAPEQTRKAAQGAVPMILAALTHKGSSPGGAAEILTALKEGGASGAMEKVSGAAGGTAEAGDRGQGLLSKIFGDRSSNVTDALAKSSGIKSSSAQRILAMVAPIVTGILGKEVLSGGLDAGGLSQLLLRHKKAVADDPSMPQGFADALGQGRVERAQEAVQGRGEDIKEHAEAARGRAEGAVQRAHERVTELEAHQKLPRQGRWLIPALAAAALAAWGISTLTRSNEPRRGVTEMQRGPTGQMRPSIQAPPAPNAPAPEPPGAAYMQPSHTGGMALPGGKTVDVAADSTEANLAHTLADDAATLPRTFRFDTQSFEPGTTTLSPASGRSVDQVATILDAYPTSQIRVVGHADLGEPQALAVARATSLKDTLVAKGIAPERIETAGMGQFVPRAPGQPGPGPSGNQGVEIILLNR
jgi:outer membrane protein OmpA-like peptidoglycan-associated protein